MTEDCFGRLSSSLPKFWESSPALLKRTTTSRCFARSFRKTATLVFKGGTSLSKCYKLIQRFSEDIDLNLEGEKRPSTGQRRRLKEGIVSTIDEFGFALRNPDQVMSRRDYNRYVIDFPSAFDFAALKPVLIVETSVFLRAYPSRKMEAASLVYDCLKREGRNDLIERYALEPFALNVQAVERTFLDKLFALGDYCLAGKVMEHSRHLYDLYKLSAVVAIDEPLKALFQCRPQRAQRTPGLPFRAGGRGSQGIAANHRARRHLQKRL